MSPDRHHHDGIRPETPHRREQRRQDQGTPLVEKLAAAAGLLIFFGLQAVLVYDGLGGRDHPPDIVLTVRTVQPVSQGWLVTVRAANVGARTASHVRITGTLVDGERVVETSAAEFDYVPDRSYKDGGLFFRNDPEKHRLDARATGYAEP